MKVLITAVLFVSALVSCSVKRELQAEVVSAQLVQIDTVNRYSGNQLYLTWKCSNNITYGTYASIPNRYQVGLVMPVMIQR
ncbi:MAG: hypothetical protein JWP69_1894 [Flaviaesturariibacter sp.]|nr:hypothetical protein [Flaviaesturariibacter sp.]